MNRSRTAWLALAAVAAFAACEDDDPMDPVDPMDDPAVEVEATTTSFMDAELGVGTDEELTATVQSTGGADLVIQSVALGGADADQFEIRSGGDMGTLVPGASRDVVIGFVPTSEGAKTATLTVTTNAASTAEVDVDISGTAMRFQYAQVDRKGIPGLNTVFNHASGVGPFDKTAYNVAMTSNDVAAYTDQFVTVLDAVGNADSEGTAALLLPDALPVSLGASPTAFASLTGRALADDAVDVALTVTVGIEELQSDNVDANDAPFRATFPYVAEPN